MSDLMTINDIAKMFRCSEVRAKDLLKLPGFPPEAPTSTLRHKLWVRREIRDFKPLVREIKAAVKKAEADAFIQKCADDRAKTAANRRHHRAKRRTAQLQRTPPWADMKAIERVYREAVRMEKETGIPHAVDHYYPLQGRNVSGLHVAGNLQVLTALDNLKKHNRYEVGND